jgi:hypothetical protein
MDSAMSRRQAIDAESKFQKPHIAAPAFALADRVVVADLGKRRAKTPIVPRGVWTGGQPYADLGKRRSGPVEHSATGPVWGDQRKREKPVGRRHRFLPTTPGGTPLFASGSHRAPRLQYLC